jgi:hypothetical protein
MEFRSPFKKESDVRGVHNLLTNVSHATLGVSKLGPEIAHRQHSGNRRLFSRNGNIEQAIFPK